MIYGAGFCSLILLMIGSLIVMIVLHEAKYSPEQSFSSRNTFASLIFHNHYAEVPTEMIEAGRIDGAGFFGVYHHIMFPLSLPGFVVVIIWQFTNIWNEFLLVVTILQNPEQQPITVALRNLSGSQIKEWNMVMAGAIIAALLTLLVYIILDRYFIRGLLAGSVKV